MAPRKTIKRNPPPQLIFSAALPLSVLKDSEKGAVANGLHNQRRHAKLYKSLLLAVAIISLRREQFQLGEGGNLDSYYLGLGSPCFTAKNDNLLLVLVLHVILLHVVVIALHVHDLQKLALIEGKFRGNFGYVLRVVKLL